MPGWPFLDILAEDPTEDMEARLNNLIYVLVVVILVLVALLLLARII